MSSATRREKSWALVRKYYAHVPSREAAIDATVLPLLEPHHALLDAGCGHDFPLLRRYASRVSYSVGLDVVAPSEKPPAGASVLVGDLSKLPFADGSFDLVVSRSVVEHLDDPDAVFGEVRRVLRAGGKLVFTTPNKYYYSSLIAGMLPYRWKDFFMSRILGDNSYDHFPVRYRANTPGAIRRVAAGAGLRVGRLQAMRHYPYYFLFSPTLFRLGMLYDWIVTGFRLDRLQSTWLVVLERASECAERTSECAERG